MGRLPRYGFIEQARSSAFIGRGPNEQHSARLAYGPGPAGSFETWCCATIGYTLPPLHVYKERTPYFHLPPRDVPPRWTPKPRQPTPAWADRLSMTPGQAAQFRSSGKLPTAERASQKLMRPQSAGQLLEKVSKSSPTAQLLQSTSPTSRVSVGCGGVYFCEDRPASVGCGGVYFCEDRPASVASPKTRGKATAKRAGSLPTSPIGVMTNPGFEADMPAGAAK